MVREPGKPRGKMTSYAFFVQTCREEHKKKNPDDQVVFAEFSKKCAARWKELSPVDRAPFEAMAGRDKLRWEEEMRHYTPPAGKPGKKKKRKQDPNAPKRPQTAFFLFCADRRAALRAANPDLNIGGIAKILGQEWGQCDPEKKATYEATAEQQKEAYKKEMELYKSGQQRQAQAAAQVQQQQHQQSSHQVQHMHQQMHHDYDDDEDSDDSD